MNALAIKTLTFKSEARQGAAADLMVCKYPSRSGEAQIVLYGDGFEASRFFSVEDLTEIREWIDNLLASRSESALRTIREAEEAS